MLKWVTNENPSLKSKRNTFLEGTGVSEEESPTIDSRTKNRRSLVTSKLPGSTKDLRNQQTPTLNKSSRELHEHPLIIGKLPAKIEMLLNNHENVLPSAGVVFLQNADEVKRVHLPASLPSMAVLENLFINAYPNSVTKKDFRGGKKMVYIKDVASGTFYELENMDEVLNLSWLKIHDKLPAGNEVRLPDDAKPRKITHTGCTSKNVCDHQQQPRPLSSLTSVEDEYDDVFGADQWDGDQRNNFTGSLKRGSAVISRKKKKNEANNKFVTWNSSGTNEAPTEYLKNNKTNKTRVMIGSDSNTCDPGLLQKSVESELENLNALLTSTFDTFEDEEVMHEENVVGEGRNKEHVNIKSPGRLDPRFLSYIESEARNAVFTRSNTLPKYYKPTIIVAAQEESRRRKNSGRCEEKDEIEVSRTNVGKTKKMKESDKPLSTKEGNNGDKRGPNRRPSTRGNNEQETRELPLFEFQNIETDEKGEPKLSTTNDVVRNFRGSTSATDALDDDVFEVSGDALTAVVESLLFATDTETKPETDTPSNSEAFVRSVPLRNTFPKYYKPNIIIQTNKKDPNETTKMLVANTNPDKNTSSTSVKMKIGRNAKKEVYKSGNQDAVNMQQENHESKEGVSSVAFQLNSTKRMEAPSHTNSQGGTEDNHKDNPKDLKEGDDRENIPPNPTDQAQKGTRRKSNLRESLVFKDLLERYGPKKVKRKEPKNGEKEITGEDTNQNNYNETVNLNESKNQAIPLDVVPSKTKGFIEEGIIGGGTIVGGIIDPSVSHLMSQIVDTERDSNVTSRNSRYLTSDLPTDDTKNTTKADHASHDGSTNNKEDLSNNKYVNERILATQQTPAASENSNTNDNPCSNADQIYAKVTKTTTSKIKLNFSKNEKSHPQVGGERELYPNNVGKETEESHYTTIKDLRTVDGDLTNSAKSVQESVYRLRRCLEEMRCAHRENARSFEEHIKDKLSEFHEKASRLDVVLRKRLDSTTPNKVTFARDRKNVQQNRHSLSREQREYANKISSSEVRLTKLENDMETFRTTVTIRNCMENPEVLDELHAELTELTKGLAEIKNRFHCIRDQLKHVISEELQVISGEERFLREEPQKLQDLVGRCKALSRTLFTLGELVNVQAELDGDVVGSDVAEAGSSSSQSSSKTTSTTGGVVTTSLHLPRQKRKK